MSPSSSLHKGRHQVPDGRRQGCTASSRPDAPVQGHFVSDLKQCRGLRAPSRGNRTGGLAHRFPTAGREQDRGFRAPE